MEEYKAYDFDGTIYDGDCSKDFFWFCLRRYPKCSLNIPIAIVGLCKYKLSKCNKKKFKEMFFGFLKYIPDLNDCLEEFWSLNERKIKKFYHMTSHSHDIIISASPEFLLEPICNKLKVNRLIASEVNERTGEIVGENCFGGEKVIRLHKSFNGKQYRLSEVYTDSYSDLPLARCASKAYLVSKNKIKQWNID